MKLLFLHPNFPGQYRYLAAALARDAANQIVAVADKSSLVPDRQFKGITLLVYDTPKAAPAETHPYLTAVDTALRRGQQVARVCLGLRQQGFVPDLVCVHPGWGDALYLKEIFPESRILGFFEFYNHAHGTERGFDPEYPDDFNQMLAARTYNAVNLLSLNACDWGISPTRWQWQAQPPEYRAKISVIFDGIDTVECRPDPAATLDLGEGQPVLTASSEVITFISRGLEPFRGWHTFIRAVPEIQRRHPRAHVVVVGSDKASYMAPLAQGTYQERYMAEVLDQLDLSRIHFLGPVSYERFLQVLQVSSVHVYLTYPAVLSWSMVEAMSAGCLVVGSRTAPVTEIIEDGVNGLLVDFFSPQEIAGAVAEVLRHPDRMQAMRTRARQTVLERFDLMGVCLPQQLALMRQLAAGRTPLPSTGGPPEFVVAE
jgi:glycosyltransferase involved in cell wall biosynthesis